MNLNTQRDSKPSSNEIHKSDRKNTDPTESNFKLNKLNPMSRSIAHLIPAGQ